MTTELDELAARALNDPGLSSAGMGEVIKSVIERTRRHWAASPTGTSASMRWSVGDLRARLRHVLNRVGP